MFSNPDYNPNNSEPPLRYLAVFSITVPLVFIYCQV